MTIKWVKSDPLVMNGEPFCYGTRLTVRNLLEMRAQGRSPADMLAEHPELRTVGIAEAFRYATQHADRYATLLGADGALQGPGFTADQLALLPAHLRVVPGMADGDAAA